MVRALGGEISEHEYLKQMVFDRYCTEVELQTDGIREQAKKLMAQGRVSEAIAKEREARQLQQRLLDERVRGEDIIYWLYWDTQARTEGLGTYPDIYEKSREARSASRHDF